MGIDFTGFRLDKRPTRGSAALSGELQLLEHGNNSARAPPGPFLWPLVLLRSPKTVFCRLVRNSASLPPPTQRGLAGTMAVQGKGVEGTRWNEGRNEVDGSGEERGRAVITRCFLPGIRSSRLATGRSVFRAYVRGGDQRDQQEETRR